MEVTAERSAIEILLILGLPSVVLLSLGVWIVKVNHPNYFLRSAGIALLILGVILGYVAIALLLRVYG